MPQIDIETLAGPASPDRTTAPDAFAWPGKALSSDIMCSGEFEVRDR
jgi:hypothetical protein